MASQIPSDRHRSHRYPTFGAAVLFCDNGEMVECLLRDISESGACLHGPAISRLPNRFEAWLPTEGVSGLARIIWRNRHACGIYFDDEKARRSLSQRIARWERVGDRTDRMVSMLRAAKSRMSAPPPAITHSPVSVPVEATNLAEMAGTLVSHDEERKLGVPLPGKVDSVDHIAALVRSRLVKTVLQGRSGSAEAELLRKILADVNVLRRLDTPSCFPSPLFGRK